MDIITNKTAEKIKTQYENGQRYKNGYLQMKTHINRCINFVEGRQWSNDPNTEDYPKVTLNYIKMIMKVRQSAILQNEYSFLMNTSRFQDARMIQYFLQYLYTQTRMAKKNLKVIADNFKKGTSGLYFYFDNDTEEDGGRLRCEVFDVRNLVVADPSIQDIQDQEWVIYSIRETVSAIKRKYGIKVDPDVEEIKDTEKEPEGEELATVYIKWFRNKVGEVHYIIATKDKVLQNATAMNPIYEEGDTKPRTNTMSTNDTDKAHERPYDRFSLYPFAVYVMDERDNCFYGVPGAYEYIEAQKSINSHFSIYDYSLGQNVLGGWIVRDGVLGEQDITTDNGQILNLRTVPGERVGDAFARIPSGSLPPDALNYGGVLGSTLRSVAGATNVQMGQADYANQTAGATQMLLARARENTSDYAMLFKEYMKDCANIMFMFAKFYYQRLEFNLIEHGNNEDTNIDYTGENAFEGEDYLGVDVGFDIQVSPSSSFNESVLQQLAMMSVQTGNLKMLSVLKMLPYNTFPSYQELQKELEKEDNTKQIMQQQQEQIAQMQQMLQQTEEDRKKWQEGLDRMRVIIEENAKLKEELTDAYANAILEKQSTAQVLQDNGLF